MRGVRSQGFQGNRALLLLLGVAAWLFLPAQGLPPAFAEAEESSIQVAAKADKTEVATGEVLTYTVTIAGALRQTPKVQLTAFEGFEVLSTGQSHQIQVGGGRSQQTLTLTYALAPTTPGTHTLGPVKIEYQGQVYETQPIEVTVIPGPPRPEGFKPKTIPETRPPPEAQPEGVPKERPAPGPGAKPKTRPRRAPHLEGGVVL